MYVKEVSNHVSQFFTSFPSRTLIDRLLLALEYGPSDLEFECGTHMKGFSLHLRTQGRSLSPWCYIYIGHARYVDSAVVLSFLLA